jgi:hypothetical protein
MSEATIETTTESDTAAEVAALHGAARAMDRDRMKRIGSYHFAMAMGALTLWGAAETWAQVTGWGIAHLAAVGNAIVAGTVIASIVHEWGHLTGARLSGAISPVLDEPKRHFFMFDFALDKNDTHQFTWMSWGGILAPWLAALIVVILVPLSLTSGAVLLATLVSKAVTAAAFEVPIVLRAAESNNPGAELGKQVSGGGLPRARNIGAAAGLVCFAMIWMAV